ncbi:hypothetical protein HDV02_002905 [Globomyces sp. JEL0801]|nr:hypothetical protein HDV02_002905 [Globomyces sp. JEL0801]
MSHLSKLLALLKYLSQILNPTIFKRVLQPIYKSWKTTLKVLEENLDDNGALKPIIELMSSNQLQAMLLAWIPVRYGSKINTGVFAVDMFVTTAIATCLVSGGTFVGKLVKTLLLQNDLSSDDELTIRVDHHRITTWGDKTINPHYNCNDIILILIVSNDAISKEYMKELIEKAPITENDSLLTSICAKFNPLENLDDVSHLDFNLIPRDDAKLTIDHEGEQYLVWFDRETEETEKKTDGQTLHSEPSLVIQKAEGSQKKTTIKDMYEWVVRISRLYDRYMDNFDERFRYEYDSENGWDVSNTLHVSRGLSAVSLDKPQEKILKKDLETFMKDREFYVRMGMPYRRGYLFSGKPGTGKTSLIHAISAAYKRNLYYINLKEIKNDANLQSAFSNIAKNSIAVLEDVDAQSSVVHNRKDTLIDGKLIRKVLQASTENLEENPSTDTKDEQQSEVDESEIGPVRLNGFKFGGPSLSTLLNCLDGYTLNDGLVLFTN